MPSRAPSPEGRSQQGSISDSQGGGAGSRSLRALVAHQPGSSNTTLLPFNRGEMISVLVQQPRNGWLYGRAESSARQGWFPASYVESMDDPPKAASSSNSTLRSTSSMTSQNQPVGSAHSQATPPPPPPPPSQPSNKSQPVSKSQPKSTSENKGSQAPRSHPELFPRGTNPFATVKLKPTSTNDRSAPKIRR